ncbi:hypothetical protein ACMBCN_01980 [Candidatus Liberibacter asiaticus]
MLTKPLIFIHIFSSFYLFYHHKIIIIIIIIIHIYILVNYL